MTHEPLTAPILHMSALVATPDDEQRTFQIAQRVRWAIANRSRVVYNGDDETFPVPIVTTMDKLYRAFTTPTNRFGGWTMAQRIILVDFARTNIPKSVMYDLGFAASTIDQLTKLKCTPSSVAIRVEYTDDTWSDHIIADASRPASWTDDDDFSR